jgi:hypothetical protein
MAATKPPNKEVIHKRFGGCSKNLSGEVTE